MAITTVASLYGGALRKTTQKCDRCGEPAPVLSGSSPQYMLCDVCYVKDTNERDERYVAARKAAVESQDEERAKTRS